ncbi:DNA/RNA non-specific endonuclease [Luteimonas lutimaris]|uniref:Type VII secretion system protein EssD-like domain-containing protein n=1 Tax=Luteimonas lutimaris TaxID=698645 RepID=A0ABP7M968_9GAMM|nr:DNA/RNA non-specific endonuclease [Luteimonas sp.]
MFESVRPTSVCPVDHRADAAPDPSAPDAEAITTALRDASFVSRPWVARNIVAGMDDAQLSSLARQDGGREALDALDDALQGAPWLMPDAPALRDRIATALRDDDPGTTGPGGVTTTTEHIGENVVTWTNDSEGRPIRAEADLTEVFTGIDRSSAETKAQRDAAGRGVEGDQGGHLIGHRFVKDQGLKNLFPQNGNFNVSAYKKLENEWADWIDAGMDVHITVGLTPENVDRPDRVRVAYEVTDPADGRVVYDQRVTFRNEAGQQFDRVPRADMPNA